MMASLFLIFLLIVMTAFFVAAEFAIVRLRPSRVDQLAQEGRRNAKAVQTVTSKLDEYLSACQLGITMTALGLGWLGEPTVEKLLAPVFHALPMTAQMSGMLSFVIAFLFVTFLHVVVGELAPKTIAIQKAEQVSVLVAPVLIWYYRLMFPFIWLLNHAANFIIQLFGFKPVSEHEEAHTEEELRIILSASLRNGQINNSEYGYVNRIFTFDDLLAREIMVPRTDMMCLYANRSLQDNLRIIKLEQYTRFPVVQEHKDHILGFVNTKQFFLRYAEDPELKLESIIQPVLTVPESVPIKHLLKTMQQNNTHLAVLVDEYGGTSGMVTIEDILEEIVGDIRDEFDKEEKREVEEIEQGQWIVDGKVSLTHINELLHIHIDSESTDTIGGWLNDQNPELRKGMAYKYEDRFCFKVLEKDRHRIRRLEITELFDPEVAEGHMVTSACQE